MSGDELDGPHSFDVDAPPARGLAPRDRVRQRRQRGVVREDRDFVNALARGLVVLEAFATADATWLGGMEVADRVGLPKPTTSRLLQALVGLGCLHYSARRRQYRLGTAVLALGFAAREPFGIGELVRPYLKELADTFNVHASLAARDRLDVMEVEVCHSLNTLMTLRLEVGSRIPLAGTATGHALMAPLPEVEFAYLLDHLRERHAKHWDTLLASIERGRREVAQQGYTTASASWNTDINGVATPLVFPGGSPVYALACGAPARHLPAWQQRKIGQRLVAIARAIEQQLRDGAVAAPPAEHDASAAG
ncbi:HTH-type transcriptional regulator TsaQ1/TsaQ2 [Rhodoplanes serenus]|jgi:DNA-binding IclR family transcriptional regulator|uniref:HTH-type transcriptional regulator TsaQ1/TsaQ2 n=1 Tax=Rhodoplanes serenus TaxID=200615 RepID=A0A447D037_9BRAD|nr:IclR family transcriptional regulator [Rhodoplanes serenus]MBI5113118.1 IclR family transcriptional regulator [Rhodovulum sp.]VCU10892.1 HTH-type transcriptional regulator TsaQ1/TsaQ2 [Rhodoplanes serenus]